MMYFVVLFLNIICGRTPEEPVLQEYLVSEHTFLYLGRPALGQWGVSIDLGLRKLIQPAKIKGGKTGSCGAGLSFIHVLVLSTVSLSIDQSLVTPHQITTNSISRCVTEQV